MNQVEPLPDPPYLRAVFLREDFDLNSKGSAFSRSHRDQDPEATDHSHDSKIHSTVMMDDDEFLQSLVSPEPSRDESTLEKSPDERARVDADLSLIHI